MDVFVDGMGGWLDDIRCPPLLMRSHISNSYVGFFFALLSCVAVYNANTLYACVCVCVLVFIYLRLYSQEHALSSRG